MTVQNVGAYGFTLLAARLLVPSSFGALTALLGVILVANVASLAVQTTTARRISVDPGSAERVAGTATAASAALGLGVGLVLVVLSPVLSSILQLDSVWPVVLCGAAVVPLTLMGALAGITQGQHRWKALSAIYISSGVGRAVFGTAAMAISATPTAAVAGIMVGAWLPVLVCLRYLRPGRLSGARNYLWEVTVGSHAMLAYLVLSNLDALLARVALSPHDSGLYGAGLILTKAALFLPQFVGIVAFPRLARARPERARRLATGAVAVVGLCATAATAAMPWLALVLVGGDQYAEVKPLLWLFALEGSILAIVQLLVFDALARRSHGIVAVLWVASGIAAGVILVAPFHVAGMVMTMAITAAVVAAAAWYLSGRTPELVRSPRP
ncbi:oligosaccharide flippase family protein [Mumia sp. zg.B17]|uniref:lipopolysaccharide biosynthesis protein n=1 Tax=unclassified Mumia TaxID=2621872 RepID=UPI001C6F03DF|nr:MULTISPECIES: oligosaccharide flippase family protein [unclassified Mumia]MBW9206184.1 oligosaccharide flippase family protein [Mumia sp. zg.B17]MBW9211522.1 oligosaccharide flippase family protein [Mumia sp. zg.B21]